MKASTNPIVRVATFALAVVTAVTLVACGGDKPSEGSSILESSVLVGKPWVTSVIQGNLPPEQPLVTDDLYTHFNYDYLADHQLVTSSMIQDHAGELQTENLKVIKDTSKVSHDLDQLRIFYGQAADAERLRRTGLSEVEPYLARVEAVNTIEEMNALLVADDFPFSPFITTFVTLSDTRGVNIVAVCPNLVLVDTLMQGGAYYQDTDDPDKQDMMAKALENSAAYALIDLQTLGMDQDSVNEAFGAVSTFERMHGKYADYNGKYVREDFGVMAEDARKGMLTLDELCAVSPAFPMREMLNKLGMGASPQYMVTPEWVAAFNGIWTTENIDVIKLIAKMNVMKETRPFRDPTTVNAVLEEMGQPVLDTETFAYEACDQMNTFSITLAKAYIEETLGSGAKERMTKLSEDIIDTYKGLVANTPWLGEQSKQRVIEKLDHITLNVLEPVGGYYDMSGIELVPTEAGGTLLGNYLKLKQYHQDRVSMMIGQPAQPASLWYALKPTLGNCFYDSSSNSINICPGYVTSLIYANDMVDEDLLAGLGFTIGHEISHGFDYQGAQFDAYGTPNPVFADADVDAFVVKSSSLASYYSGLEVAPHMMVSGETVVTEATADLCGMHSVLELANKNGGTDYRRFYTTFCNIWAGTVSEMFLPSLLLDVHALDNHRVNVNSQMFEELYETFGVKEGDRMYLAPQERINMWGQNA